MTRYLRIKEGARSVVAHPGFRTSDTNGESRLMTDAELVPFGYHRIVDAPEPEHDPIQQRLQLVPPEGWEINDQGQAVRRHEVVERPVPPAISAVQFRITAQRHGLLTTIETLMQDPQMDAEARIAWEHAREFERGSPTIEALRQHPGIDLAAGQVDDLFREASQIVV